MTFEIIPGILERNWNKIEDKLNTLIPLADSIHIDIIDGKFVNNTTFLDPEPFKKYSDKVILEAHFMVDDPYSYLDSFAKNGFKKFIGHIERMKSQEDFVAHAQSLGKVYLALDGPTEIEKITVPLKDLDGILVYMGERVGFSNGKILPERLDKLNRLRSLTDINIEVDGGINDQTIKLTQEKGANEFVSTSYLTPKQNTKTLFDRLKNLIED